MNNEHAQDNGYVQDSKWQHYEEWDILAPRKHIGIILIDVNTVREAYDRTGDLHIHQDFSEDDLGGFGQIFSDGGQECNVSQQEGGQTGISVAHIIGFEKYTTAHGGHHVQGNEYIDDSGGGVLIKWDKNLAMLVGIRRNLSRSEFLLL